MKRQSITKRPVEVNRLSASVRCGNNPESVSCVGAARDTSKVASTHPTYLFILQHLPGFQGPADLYGRQQFLACMQNTCDMPTDRMICWKNDPKPRSMFDGGARWTGWSEAESHYLSVRKISDNQGGNIVDHAYENYELVKSADDYLRQASRELHQLWHERTEMNGGYRPEKFRVLGKLSIKSDQSDIQIQAEIEIQVIRPVQLTPQELQVQKEQLLLRTEARKDNTCLTFSFQSGIKQRCYEELLAKWIVRKEELDRPEIAKEKEVEIKEEDKGESWEDYSPVATLLKAVSEDTQHEEIVTDESQAVKEPVMRPTEEHDPLLTSDCLAEHESNSAYAQWLEARQYGVKSQSSWVLHSIFFKMYPSLFRMYSDRAWWDFQLPTHIRTMRGEHMYPIIVIRKPDMRMALYLERIRMEKENKEVEEEILPPPPKLEPKTPSFVLGEVGSVPVANNLLIVSNREVEEYIEKEGGAAEGFVVWKGVLVPWSVKDAYDENLPPWRYD